MILQLLPSYVYVYGCIHAVSPEILFPPDDTFTYTVNESSTATFECSSTGIPPPSILWTKNNKVLDEASDPRVSMGHPSQPELFETDDGFVFVVNRTLNLADTVGSDTDTYTCLAFNGVDPNDTQNFELFVQGIPFHLSCVLFKSFLDCHSSTSCGTTGLRQAGSW